MSSRAKVLLDSNAIIYASNDPNSPAAQYIGSIDPVVSIVTRIEVLGYSKITPESKKSLEAYFEVVAVLPLDDDIAETAIALRQRRKMSLGDCMIAATAVEYGLPLATSNVRDFSWITELQLIDLPVPAAP